MSLSRNRENGSVLSHHEAHVLFKSDESLFVLANIAQILRVSTKVSTIRSLDARPRSKCHQTHHFAHAERAQRSTQLIEVEAVVPHLVESAESGLELFELLWGDGFGFPGDHLYE